MPLTSERATRTIAIRNAIISEFGVDLQLDDVESEQRERSYFLAALLVMRMVKSDGKAHCIERYPHLYIGSVGAAYNLSELKSAGITHVLCAACTPRERFPSEFKYLKLHELNDKPSVNILPYIDQICDFIDEAFTSGGKVLVHCFKGVSRSATVICAYLISRHGLTLADALELVRSARPNVAPNQGFIRQLRQLEHPPIPTICSAVTENNG